MARLSPLAAAAAWSRAMKPQVLLTLFAFTALPLAAAAADFPGPLKVTFRTTDCDGATGMGSVDANWVARIQPYTCPGGRALKQLLVHTASGSYEVFTVTADEALNIEAQVQSVTEARKKALEQTKPIILDR
jgi:hypothetical protein